MRYLVVCLLLVALAGCGVPSFGQSCAEQSAPFMGEVLTLANEWDDAAKLAGSTPRGSLPPQISRLQDIRRKVQALTPPDCAKAAQTTLMDAMDKTIQAYIDFLGQKPDGTVKDDFEAASTAMTAFAVEMARIRGTPVPAP
jgi:hypothetical protein